MLKYCFLLVINKYAKYRRLNERNLKSEVESKNIMARTGAVRHRRAWWMTASTLVSLGCLTSVVGARAVAKNDALASRHLFEASSLDVVSTLRLDIVHEQDLVVSTGAYFVSFPHANQADFRRWMSALNAFSRYPELEGVGEIVMVTTPGIAAFEAAGRTAIPRVR